MTTKPVIPILSGDMGLGWLARNFAAIVVWVLIVVSLAGIVIATVGGVAGIATVTETGGIIIFIAATVAIIGGGGYALASTRNREGRLARLEGNVTDIQTRLTRIEDEHLQQVATVLGELDEKLGGRPATVRQFRRREN